MFIWPFGTSIERKRDAIDEMIESPAWKETEREAAEAGKFWARVHKQAAPKVREALIEEARIKFLHRGGKP